MVQNLEIETSAGGFVVTVRLHTDRERPCLLATSGLGGDDLNKLIDMFPGANVLIARLPGIVSPWSGADLAELTGGLEEAVRPLLRGLPTVALGMSIGGLLTLGLRIPSICRLVLVEPFFQTESLWPFIAFARRWLIDEQEDAQMAKFLWKVFGIGRTELENRNYLYLLENLALPTDVLLGRDPLMPRRAFEDWPSFTSTDDRAALAAHPMITVAEGPAGHRVADTPEGEALLRTRLLEALRAASTRCAPRSGGGATLSG